MIKLTSPSRVRSRLLWSSIRLLLRCHRRLHLLLQRHVPLDRIPKSPPDLTPTMKYRQIQNYDDLFAGGREKRNIRIDLGNQSWARRKLKKENKIKHGQCWRQWRRA